MKKMKREKERRTKDNLILSHVNLTFVQIGPSNWTLYLYTLIVPYKKKVFVFNVKKGLI
jgi:hypothetical protein